MPIDITHMRDLMMPGLRVMMADYDYMKQQWAAEVFNRGVFVPATPHIWVPKLSLPMAVAAGAAAMIIKNPVVTRRFWSGWVR